MVKAVSGLQTEMPFDSSVIETARKNLRRTGLFSKIDIVYLSKDTGVDIYLFLREAPALLLSDIGGELYSHKYGEQDLWWRMRFGFTHNNFRGLMERLSVNVSFWEWRSLGAYWHKPVINTPYFLGLGSYWAQYPYDIYDHDYQDISARITAGRQLSANSRIGLSIVPTFRRRHSRDTLDNLKEIPETLKTYDTTDFYEAFALIGLVFDNRSNRFDPENGYYSYSEIKTNLLYPGINRNLIQFSNDFRFYFPGISTDHKLALRLNTVLRYGDAGTYHRLLYGGDGQVRGYYKKKLGLTFVANNSLILSSEYRFPIWHAPEMYFPLINLMYSGINVLSWRLDGAVFFDYVRMWPNLTEIFSKNGKTETGRGFGAGLRVMFPAIQTSGCIDIAFGERRSEDNNSKRFTWPPITHLYLNMHF
ncbi:hypothetical protein CHISP_3526 [Chitinispirillum alkaliphilum]|nr:hypothetical protein CHISP_3526 [Chitinispirillum alkaliphilum]